MKSTYNKIEKLKKEGRAIGEDLYKELIDVNLLYKALESLAQSNHNSNDYIDNNIWLNSEYQNKLLELNKLKYTKKIEDDKYQLFLFKINELDEKIIDIILDSFPLEYFRIEIKDENGKRLSDLSFGEQQLLFILNQIYFLAEVPEKDLYDIVSPEEIQEQGQNIDAIQRFFKVNYIILFDEIDMGFHPDWQKRALQYIFDFLNASDNGKYYHLILTTHSPFLISDIPTQNIIFLDKDENGNCKVVDGLKEKKQTFGANIHTLLSDSFFMEDGLMGEFAKGKIDELILYLNGKEDTNIKSNDEAQKLINIIGEPIVKKQLQRMLDSKRLKKIEEIDILKKSIEDMQKRLEELENDKN